MPNNPRLNSKADSHATRKTSSVGEASPTLTESISESANPDLVNPVYAKVPLSNKKEQLLIANGSQAFFWYLLSFVVLGIDQWTKWLAETKLIFNEPNAVIEPILNWTLAYNYGAAFSFLADQGGWQKWLFSGLAFAMSAVLVVYLVKAPRQAKLLNVGLALILGGAVGNLIDRVRIGKVIDFIHVHYADVWHYPIFNVADMAICVGVTMVLFDILFLEKKRDNKYQTQKQYRR